MKLGVYGTSLQRLSANTEPFESRLLKLNLVLIHYIQLRLRLNEGQNSKGMFGQGQRCTAR